VRRRLLFLARDRLGKKPLVYAYKDGTLSFASEIRALLEDPEIDREIDLNAIDSFLQLQYVPAPLTAFAHIRKLLPAHTLVWQDGRVTVDRYWSLSYAPLDQPPTPEEAQEEIRRLILRATELRLRSDVPVGVFLSGGLDSSLVAAAAQRVSNTGLNTFTVAFPGTSHDESGYADLVARHLGSEHRTLEVPAPSFDILDELADKLDEPLADSSLIPSYLVSKFTRAHVKVALGGDGGDELFGGYADYRMALADAARLGWVPDGLLRGLGRLAGLLPAGVRGRNRLYALQGGPFQSLIWGTPYFDIDLRRRILSRDARAVLNDGLDEPERWLLSLFHEGGDPVDAMTRTHFGSILADDFLVKVDRASMAVGLELRSPFLDTRLVEFGFGSIPWNWKVQGRESRRIERILAHRWLPSNLDLNRKQGFSIPLNEWLRTTGCQLVEAVRSHLPPAINQEEVSRLIAGHRAGRANGGRLYALQMLAMTNRPQGYAT